MVELDLRPGNGVGIFELGSSLWSTLDALQQHTQKTLYPQIDVKYDTTNPSSSPVVIHLRPHVDLLFSPLSQRLTLINIRHLRAPGHALVVKYRDKTISSNTIVTGNGTGVVFRRATVNQVFGPTYSGDVMRFPGVWFGFEEDGILNHAIPGHGHASEDRNQEVKRIVVTQRTGSDETAPDRDALDEPLECSELYGELKKAIVKLDRDGGSSAVLLYFHLPPTSSAAQMAPVEVRLGETSAQDLIAEMGSPLRVHYKEDDRMTIHRTTGSPNDPSMSSDDDDDEGYFYNYFQFGIDILISGTTHIVQKVILHSNVPGSYLFQRYKRCLWEIQAPSRAAPGQSSVAPALALETSAFLEPPPPKGGKKGRKKGASKGSSPEPDLIDLVQDAPAPSEAPSNSTSRPTSVSLFDKIDVIKAALTNSSNVSPSAAQTPSRSVAIPVARSPPSYAGFSPRPSASTRSSSHMPHLALSTSPPTMVLDRSSETGNVETTSLVGGTTQLMGFDGLVLEVSELGDVLSVVVF